MSHTSHAGAVSVDERRVSTPHGAIFVREAPGDGPAVVLMHGFPDDQRIYARLLPLLSTRRAVTFDFLGYGRSDRSATAGFTPDDQPRKSPRCSTRSTYRMRFSSAMTRRGPTLTPARNSST
jgi:pimeloyl-ACP methyl ester carboxylesterase